LDDPALAELARCGAGRSTGDHPSVAPRGLQDVLALEIAKEGRRLAELNFRYTQVGQEEEIKKLPRSIRRDASCWDGFPRAIPLFRRAVEMSVQFQEEDSSE